MKILGFHIMLSDDCLYRHQNLWLVVYVYDIILMGIDQGALNLLKQELRLHFELKDLKVLSTFVCVQFIREGSSAWLSQTNYIGEIPKRFGMRNCRSITTPMAESAVSDVVDAQGTMCDRTTYQELHGSLLFVVTRTRPDTSVSVRILNSYAAPPFRYHWAAWKRICASYRELRRSVFA